MQNSVLGPYSLPISLWVLLCTNLKTVYWISTSPRRNWNFKLTWKSFWTKLNQIEVILINISWTTFYPLYKWRSPNQTQIQTTHKKFKKKTTEALKTLFETKKNLSNISFRSSFWMKIVLAFGVFAAKLPIFCPIQAEQHGLVFSYIFADYGTFPLNTRDSQ